MISHENLTSSHLESKSIRNVLNNEELSFLPCLNRICRKFNRPYHKRNALFEKFKREFSSLKKIKMKDFEKKSSDVEIQDSQQPIIKSTKTIDYSPNFLLDIPSQTSYGKIIMLEIFEREINIGTCDLNGNLHSEIDCDHHQFPLNIRIGNATEFFNYLAEIFDKFVKSRKINPKRIDFGWTFGYSMNQTSINDGQFISWNGSLQVSNMNALSLKEHLTNALTAKGYEVHIHVMSCLSLAYLCGLLSLFKTAKFGVNFDSQLSVVYVDEINGEKKLINLNVDKIGDYSFMECMTKVDHCINRESDESQRILSKFISLKGMSEVFRRSLIRLIKAKEVLNGKMPDKIDSPSSIIFSPFICNQSLFRNENYIVVEESFIIVIRCSFSKDDFRKVQHLARCIIRRSCHVIGIILAAMVSALGSTDCIIGLGGSLIKNNSTALFMIEYMVDKLLGGKNFILYDCNSIRLRGLAAAVSACKNYYQPKVRYEIPYAFLPKSLKIKREILYSMKRDYFSSVSVSRSISLYDDDPKSLVLSDMKNLDISIFNEVDNSQESIGEEKQDLLSDEDSEEKNTHVQNYESVITEPSKRSIRTPEIPQSSEYVTAANQENEESVDTQEIEPENLKNE